MLASSIAGKTHSDYSLEENYIVIDANDAFEWEETLLTPIEGVHPYEALPPIKNCAIYYHLLLQPFQKIVIPPPKKIFS